jgi:hypothetical protein
MNKTSAILGLQTLALIAAVPAIAATPAKPAASKKLVASKTTSPRKVAATTTPAAPTSAPAPTTTAQVADIAPAPYNKIALTYFGIYEGPSFKNPSAKTTTADGELKEQNIENYLTGGYRVNPDVLVGATMQFNWTPVNGAKQADMRDPYLRANHNKFINAGNFNMYADARAYLPVTDGSRKADGISTYSLGRWTIGATTFFRTYLYGLGPAASGETRPDFYVYLSPSLEYKILPTLAATALWEGGAYHVLGEGLGKFNSDGTDAQVGVSWDATSNLNLNPYIHYWPAGTASKADSTRLGVNISAKFL